MAPLWHWGRAGADHCVRCDSGLWLDEADHVTWILPCDWLTESDVGGPVLAQPGHCHPRSTILISFWLQITLWPSHQWDTGLLGQSHGATRNTRAQHFCVWILDADAILTWGSRKVSLAPDVLLTDSGPGGWWPGRGHRPGPGIEHWSDCFITWRRVLLELGALYNTWRNDARPKRLASPNSENLKGRVRRWRLERQQAKFLDYIDLGIDITPRDYAITNPLICPCLASHKFRCKM